MAQSVQQKSILDHVHFETSDRAAVWLASDFQENVWKITDDDGANERKIDFHVVLSNGRCLTTLPKLLDVAKETMYWLRRTAQRATSSGAHVQQWNTLQNILHAASLLRIRSLSELLHSDIVDMVSRMAFGVDALIRTEDRVTSLLSQYERLSDLPAYLVVRRKGVVIDLNANAVRDACHLPEATTKRKTFKTTLDKFRGRFALSPRVAANDTSTVVEEGSEEITGIALSSYTCMFESLYTLRHVMRADTLIFEPFPEEGAYKAAENLGKSTTPTRIAPIDLVFRLLESCTKLLSHKSSRIIKSYTFRLKQSRLGVLDYSVACQNRSWVRRLSVACYILIAAFSARRRIEMLKLKRDCLTGNDEDGWWLHVYIAKNHKAYTWIPIPTLVARAVTALIEIGRAYDGDMSSDLFSYYDLAGKQVVSMRPHAHLKDFAKEVGAENYIDESGLAQTWEWESRQFRRFFAVMFFYRHGGSIEALRHHLRHFNLEMTRSYLTMEKDLAAIWFREEYNFKRSLIVEVANDNSNFTGPMGERVKKLKDRIKAKLRSKITVVTPEEADVLLRMGTRLKWVITPKPWVNCSCPLSEQAASVAKCRGGVLVEGDIGPAFENAGPSRCGNCPWAMITAANRSFVAEQRAEMAPHIIPRNSAPNFFEQLQMNNFAKLATYPTNRAA